MPSLGRTLSSLGLAAFMLAASSTASVGADILITERFPDPEAWMRKIESHARDPGFRDQIVNFLFRKPYRPGNFHLRDEILAYLDIELPKDDGISRSAYLIKGPVREDEMDFVLVCATESGRVVYFSFETRRVGDLDWRLSNFLVDANEEYLLRNRLLSADR